MRPSTLLLALLLLLLRTRSLLFGVGNVFVEELNESLVTLRTHRFTHQQPEPRPRLA